MVVDNRGSANRGVQFEAYIKVTCSLCVHISLCPRVTSVQPLSMCLWRALEGASPEQHASLLLYYMHTT